MSLRKTVMEWCILKNIKCTLFISTHTCGAYCIFAATECKNSATIRSYPPYCRRDEVQCSSQHPAKWDLLSHCSPAVLNREREGETQEEQSWFNTALIVTFYNDVFLLAGKSREAFIPTALVWPFSAAIMSGVFPAASTLLTWELWLSSSWRHSTWSVKAAACSGVLQTYNNYVNF